MKFRLTAEAEKELVATIETIMREHVGAVRAIGRTVLLAELRRFEPLLSDRMMRRIIEDRLPHICSSARGGYFLPKDPNEKKRFDDYLTNYAMSILTRRSKLRRAYPELNEMRQMEFGFKP